MSSDRSRNGSCFLDSMLQLRHLTWTDKWGFTNHKQLNISHQFQHLYSLLGDAPGRFAFQLCLGTRPRLPITIHKMLVSNYWCLPFYVPKHSHKKTQSNKFVSAEKKVRSGENVKTPIFFFNTKIRKTA